MFFEKFKHLSKENGISVNAVAKELNLSSGSVTAWKNGTNPNANTVSRIAQFFGVSDKYLLGLTDDPMPSEAQAIPAIPATDKQLKFALFGDPEMDDDILEDIKAIAKVHAERKKKRTE